MTCSTIVVIGSTGDGKSTFLNALVGGNMAFGEDVGAHSVTQKTEAKRCRFQENGAELILCDTQGISDSQGLDNNHIKQMVEELKKLDYLNMVAIVINGTNVRFSVYVQETMKLFVNIFTADVLKHVSIVFTHWNVTQYDQGTERRIEQEYNEKFRQMFNITDSIPCFFIDSCFNRLNIRGNYTYDTEDRNLYSARLQTFYGTLVSMGKLNPIKFVPADRDFQSITTETQTVELSRTVTPIFEEREKRRGGLGRVISINGSGYKTYTVHVGNRTTIIWREQKREVKTLYNGQQIFGDWVVVRQWEQIC